MAFAAFGFFSYLVLDQLALLHSHNDTNHAGLKGRMGLGTLSVHSLLDGIAIGVAFQQSATIAAVMAIAIVAHDFSDGINTVGLSLKNKMERKESIKWLLINSITPVIGIIATFFFTLTANLLGLVLSLFAGFFLYIGANDLLPQSINQYPKIWTTFMTLLGATVTFLVTRYLDL